MTAVHWTKPYSALNGLTPVEWLQQNRPSTTARELAAQLSELLGQTVTRLHITNATARFGIVLEAGAKQRMYEIRSSPVIPRWDNPPQVDGDALILSDMQCPFQDDEFIGQCVRLARKWQIKNLILAGDTYDLQSLNHFDQSAQMPVADELRTVERTLTALRKGFTRVLMLTGNHEERLARSVGGKFSLRDVLSHFLEAENIEFSDYFHCYIGNDWCVSHQKNASAIHGRTPYFITAREQRHMICTHNHLAGMAFDISGRLQGIDSGMCADPAKLQYAMIRHNTRPKMNQGAVIIRKGYAWWLHPTRTDWAALWKM